MLTPHELELVLAHRRLKMMEGFSLQIAQSHTLQAVISSLTCVEIQELRKAKTFSEVMNMVAELKERKGGLKILRG